MLAHFPPPPPPCRIRVAARLSHKSFFGFADGGKRNYRLFSFAFFFVEILGNATGVRRMEKEELNGERRAEREKIAGPQGWEKYVSLCLSLSSFLEEGAEGDGNSPIHSQMMLSILTCGEAVRS